MTPSLDASQQWLIPSDPELREQRIQALTETRVFYGLLLTAITCLVGLLAIGKLPSQWLIGGVAVLAHPYLNGLTDLDDFESFLLTLINMGLEGVEAVYPQHPEAATAHYCRLALKHNLLITGGTDFHGAMYPIPYMNF